MQLLPPKVDIYNYIYEGNGGGRLDNVISFYKSWILKSVRAVTKYEASLRNWDGVPERRWEGKEKTDLGRRVT